MRVTHLSVTNYCGLRDVTIPLSSFGCLIGENNAGKSTVLKALKLFHSGSSLTRADFFDPAQPVRIEVRFEDVGDADLAGLNVEHRDRIAEILEDGRLTLVRRYNTDGKSGVLYQTLAPKDPRLSRESVASWMKGQRPGAALVASAHERFPEIVGTITTKSTQSEIQAAIDGVAKGLPRDQLVLTDRAIPTGLDKSIDGFLPEPIYIPAVKDLSDETKTKEATPFGKILSILLNSIHEKLVNEDELFRKLHAKLSRVEQPDGAVVDDRLPEVREIEKVVERLVQESFRNVQLELHIPPLEVKTVLSAAQIYVNDGVRGLVDTKGDGLRRAIVFAILRAYVELRSRASPAATQTTRPYMLLFEEPELFLHPKAQLILFHALSEFARHNIVLVTTHSPAFFAPGTTATFVKLEKVTEPSVSARPFTKAHAIDLSDISAKDQFQLICYENNSAAFFASTVVLVEGDSDFLVLPHVAKTLDPSWDPSKTPVRFARIHGKSSIRRYRAIFARFNVRTTVICDLDLLLGEFGQLDPEPDLKAKHSELMQLLDASLAPGSSSGQLTLTGLQDANRKGELKALWSNARQLYERARDNPLLLGETFEALEQFFAWERKNLRLEALRRPPTSAIANAKKGLIDALRAHDVFVLERGAIEAYYPPGTEGTDKPSRAQAFCKVLVAAADLVKLDAARDKWTSDARTEFGRIFAQIFVGSSLHHATDPAPAVPSALH